MKVIMNRISPSAISAEVYKSPTASVNSLAMVAEMVVPGASTEAEMRCALPITKVTAMVLAEAAAEAEHHAADDADPGIGSTTLRTTSRSCSRRRKPPP